MIKNELCVKHWIEIIRELGCFISKRGHLCPILHKSVKNRKYYVVKVKRIRFIQTQLMKIFLCPGTQASLEERTWDMPCVLNLFSIRFWIPVNDHINLCLVGFPSE